MTKPGMVSASTVLRVLPQNLVFAVDSEFWMEMKVMVQAEV